MGKLAAHFLIPHGFHKARVLIETGTQQGHRLARVASLFPEVHTIEIREDYWTLACERLAPLTHVHCHCGNSLDLLPIIIDTAKRTVLWLDAHFDGEAGTTPQPDVILRELDIVLGREWQAPFVALIDDADKFYDSYWKSVVAQRHNRSYWPKEEEVLAKIRQYGYDCSFMGKVWAVKSKDWV